LENQQETINNLYEELFGKQDTVDVMDEKFWQI
jgi:hypothetical protein